VNSTESPPNDLSHCRYDVYFTLRPLHTLLEKCGLPQENGRPVPLDLLNSFPCFQDFCPLLRSFDVVLFFLSLEGDSLRFFDCCSSQVHLALCPFHALFSLPPCLDQHPTFFFFPFFLLILHSFLRFYCLYMLYQLLQYIVLFFSKNDLSGTSSAVFVAP